MYDIYTIFLLINKNDLFKVKIDDSIYTYNDLIEILNKDKNKAYFTFSDFYNFVKDKEVKLMR